MSVLCSTCGRFSEDLEFCDYCNADLSQSGKPLPPERCPLSLAGVPLSSEQRRILCFPESSILVEDDTRIWRVHWISAIDWAERGSLLERRLAATASSLPDAVLLEDTYGRWLALEAHPGTGKPWQQPAEPGTVQELQRLSAWTSGLADAMQALHERSLVWLNFDPNSVEDLGPSAAEPAHAARRLRFTNLDLELFPFRAMPERVRVHPSYAAPEIVQFRINDIGPRTDVFHLAMFAYYWLAGKLPDGFPGEGLERYQFEIPPLRLFTQQLPTGIIPVVMRGIKRSPAERFATPRHFADALTEAIARVEVRRRFAGLVRWEIGGESRVGRSKTELQRGNEDAVLICDHGASAGVAVADGVSTCDIGSGAIASMMTTIVIENALADGCSHETFPELMTAACRRGSEGLLEWALAHNCRADLEANKDLMGTTLTAAWLEGHEVSIANLGDSRVYLITAHAIEQLTVDGDLASDLLLGGAPPEEVKELGSMSRALRECIGGCTRDPNGELCILPESTQPKISRWPILPGDVLVLCSDGLVEEGFFLDPDAVAEIVRARTNQSPVEVALHLADAADALQRVPTVLEPDGFGDNISCIVVRIKDATSEPPA